MLSIIIIIRMEEFPYFAFHTAASFAQTGSIVKYPEHLPDVIL